MQNNIGEETDLLLHKGAKELPSKDYDSLDYDVCYNVPYKRMISRYSKFTYLHVQLMKWVLVGIIGMMTGLVAFMIDACVKYLFKLKFSVFEKVYNASLDSGSVAISLLVLLGFNCSFVVIAALMTVWEPVAAGSGIPEIKCYLNGVKVPHVTRVSTLVAKASGVLFSVSGGLFVGKEGPMIHSGAILGAGISQLRSMLPFLKKLPIPYPHFRSDRDKRDFVSSGAAAGVAAAFGAPIGGVLFSLEEGSSFWNQSLTWRTLFCSFSATFTLNFFLSGTVIPNLHWGELGQGGLVDFGVFNNQQRDAWTAWHVIIFVLLGVIGGLAGALFNSINTSITVYRMKHLQRRTWKGFWKVMEVILIASVTTVCVFGLSMSLSRCIPVSGNVTLLQTKYETKNFFCPTDTGRSYINDMATVLFNSEESAIKQFFHLTDSFTLTSLWFLCVLYFIIACWTYGAGVPSGLFIPCLAVGATYGRLIANFINYYNIPFFNTLYPASYALLGAASFLGGVVRMTISLTVIIIEATNEINYGLPILITIMVSKWIGDLFNHGLYDVHIELRRTPMLGWDSPERMDRLASADVMAEKLSYVYPITRVSSVVQLLRTTYFSAFPVVTPFQNFQAKPQNVSGKHIPGLYSSRQFISLTDYDLDSDADTCRSDSAFVEVMSPNARHAKKEESTDSTVTITPTNKDAPIHSRVNSYGAVAVDYHPFDPGELRQSEGEEEEENVFPHYPLLFHDSRKASLSYTLADTGLRSSHSSLQQEDTRVFKQPLVLHGIILRSQLITLLRNKVFFDEEYGAESQKELPHADMIEDYPRYKTIYDVSLTSEEKKKLMDLSVYMNPCPYTISNQAPLPQVFNLFRTMGLRHLPVVQDFGILIGMITRHDLTHERLQQARYMKRRKDRQKAREQRSLRSTAKL